MAAPRLVNHPRLLLLILFIPCAVVALFCGWVSASTSYKSSSTRSFSTAVSHDPQPDETLRIISNSESSTTNNNNRRSRKLLGGGGGGANGKKLLSSSSTVLFDFTPFKRRYRNHVDPGDRQDPDYEEMTTKIDPRFGAEKRRIPSGPNPLHH